MNFQMAVHISTFQGLIDIWIGQVKIMNQLNTTFIDQLYLEIFHRCFTSIQSL